MKLFQREEAEAEAAAPPGAAEHAAPSGSGAALPDPPHPVKLVFPGGEPMPARVTARGADELTVLMLYEPTRPLREAERRSILIEVTDDGRTTRLGGCASVLDEETLRFTELHVVQRREYVRVKARLAVQIKPAGEGEALECVSVDLSGGGMLLHGLEALSAGERVGFAFLLGEEERELSGEATVVRVDHDGDCALCFETISEADRRRLIRFLFERQREERRRGLRPDC